MSLMFQSSGDLIADRRYEHAQAAAAEGDHAAAQDLLLQTLELTPHWPAAWFALGEARLALADAAGARDAYRRCRDLDAEDAQGAGVALAALGEAGDSPPAMSPSYLRHLFDQYAERFDSHLTKKLAYRGPELIHDAITRACAIEGIRPPFRRALDLGCGTGLLGEAIGDMARVIDGVDISPRMIRMAKKRGCYDKLATEEMIAFLNAGPPARYDLVAAADVFVYAGDLAPGFAGAARILSPRGLFAFSVQRAAGEKPADYALGPDRRFSHSIDYVKRALAAAGFAIVRLEHDSTRTENNAPVPGAVVVAIRR